MRAQDLEAYLNELLTLDPIAVQALAVQALIDNRVPCNEGILNHPTVLVSGEGEVGILGILNGMLNDRLVAAVYEDDGRLVKFITR